ncbi:hypothetical protein N7524_010826 [Penicillium chrysogenum]|nr:hypothetical protein N7524_010826 [Penicillium chrysogenum]
MDWHQQAFTDSEFVSLWKLLFAYVFVYLTTATSSLSSPPPSQHVALHPTSGSNTLTPPLSIFLANGIAVVIDVMILFIPAPIIRKLQMPKSQRVAVTSILLFCGL